VGGWVGQAGGGGGGGGRCGCDDVMTHAAPSRWKVQKARYGMASMASVR